MTQFGKSLVWVCVALLAIGFSFVLYPREKPLESLEAPDVMQAPTVPIIETYDNSVIPKEVEEIFTPYTVTGYYTKYVYERIYDGAYYGTTSCDAFIITKNDNLLTQDFLAAIKSGNTWNKLTSDGIRVNIAFDYVSTSTISKIRQSSFNKQIEITMRKRTPDAKEAPFCASPVRVE